jgi:hypothetical protein
MGVQKHNKKRFTKQIVSKSFYFLQKTDFSSIFFKPRFWAFLDEGSSKTRQKNIPKTNLTLVLFRTLTHPPTTGVTDFFVFAGLLHVAHVRPIRS